MAEPLPKTATATHVYLAGPDVFYSDAITRGAQKRQAVAAAGMTPHFPFDNEFKPQPDETLQQLSFRIAAANEQMMRDCAKPGHVGVILADMTPWHGPSLDVGTAFEIGFMSALAQQSNIIIIGYYQDATDHQDSFAERVNWQHYEGRATLDEQGVMRAPDSTVIENFGNHDNLMIDGAIAKSGGRICASFAEAVAAAKELSDARMTELADDKWQRLMANREAMSIA